jgi:hypothetical protein
LNIHDPLAQVGIVDGFQSLAIFLNDLLEDMLDIAMIPLEPPQNFIDQSSVFHNEQVRIENTRVLRSDGGNDTALDVEKLDARGNQRRFESDNFSRKFFRRNAAREDFLVFGIIYKGREMGYPLGDRNTMKPLFLFVFNGGVHS